ncbi:sugar ABC transporter substrate-binding protein [Lachnospiraceae bacterium 62-35]
MKKRNMQKFAVLLTAAMTLGLLTGCTSSSDSASATTAETTEAATEAAAKEDNTADTSAAAEGLPGEGKTIAFVPKQLGNPYFVAVRDAVEEKAIAQGFKFECNAPDSSIEVDKQVSICEAFINQGVDVLIVIPNDATAIVDVINSAAEKGIAVFLVDSGADESNYISYIGTDNYAGGVLAAQWFEENITGKVAIIDGAAGNAATTARKNGFMDTLKDSEKIEIVSTDYGNGDMATAMSVAENYLTAYPDLSAIFCCDDPMGQGAGQAVIASGKDIFVCGFDGSPDGAQAIIDGVMDMSIAQTPRVMGELAVEYAIAYLNGESVDPVINTDCEIVTSENASDFLNWH